MAKRNHYFEHFTGVTHMLETAETRHASYHNKNDSHATGDPRFFGKETYEEARELLLNGWKEGADAILKGVKALEQGYSTPTQSYGVAGYMPNVGMYCAGNPAHMARSGADYGRKKVLRFAFNCGGAHHITADEKANFGIALLTVINALEARNFSLELTAYKKTTASAGSVTISTLVKNAGEPLDAERVAFVTSHAGYQRRFMFALLESKEEYNFLTDTNYGYTANVTNKDIGDDTYILDGLSTSGKHCDTPENAARWLIKTTNKLIGEDILDINDIV